MYFKSIFAVLALTATSVVLAAPTPTDKPEDCPGKYDWGSKSCHPKPPKCDYGYDDYVRAIRSRFVPTSLLFD